MTRRSLLAGAVAPAFAQIRPGNGPRVRATPAVCLYSKVLSKIEYQDLGNVLQGMGLDGADLSVEPGGHVLPDKAVLHLMRAVEAITGLGLDVPMISMAATDVQSTESRNVLAIIGEMGIPCCRPGYWAYGDGDIDTRLAQVQRDLAGFLSIGRAVGTSIGIHNRGPGFVGSAIWDTQMLIRGMDARWVGFDYDIGYATAAGGAEGWPITLRVALPRLKMVTVRDFIWKDGKMTPCPLGEGVVDWPGFFGALAKARFNGPLSLQIDHNPASLPEAIRKDQAFIRKQIAAAYQTG